MTLLERDLGLQELTRWLETAVERGGLVVLVRGEAGIGKTALLEEFATCQNKAPRLLWGGCDALFTPRPLAPLHDIARKTQGGLQAALQAGARDAIFTAMLDELERGAPALMVLEDLHWADDATLDLLKFLGRRIARTHSLLVVSYRDDELGPRHPLRFVIGELPRNNVRQLQLSSLSQEAVAALAREAGKAPEGLHAATGGNPFFITEVLAADSDAVPVSVRDAVLARAMRLSPSARAIAELVSVIPGKAERWLLEQAVQLDEGGVEGCLAIGMVRDADGSLAFRHELARRALEGSLPEPQRQGLHTRVLAILAQHPGVSMARLAHHADGARDATEVLRYAPLAAEQAASVGARREAAAHYRLALRYAPQRLKREEIALLQERLSYECYLTDQIESAIEAREAALEIWRSTGARLREGDALRWLSRLTWFGGQRAAAERYAAEAVALLESLPAGRELAMAYSNLAQLEMLGNHSATAITLARRTIALIEADHVDILCHALNNLGTARLVTEDEGGAADLERSLSIALEHGFQEHAARAYTNLASSAVNRHRFAEGERYLAAGIAYCEEHDLESWRIYMLAWRARAWLELGEWDQASEAADTVVNHPRTAAVNRIPALVVLGSLRTRRGDPGANECFEEAAQMAAATAELQRLGPLACARADAAWLAGDTGRIAAEMAPAYELARPGDDHWKKGAVAVWLWRAKALGPDPLRLAAPYAMEISGDWRGAARAWAELGCRYEQATVLAWHGDADAQLEALAIADGLGAGALASLVRRQLRARGVRKVPRGSRQSTRSHPHGLTRREAQVLQLLSEGMANARIARRLFVSPKTVEHHVSAILAKLGVPSRAEAVALARTQEKAAE